MKFESVALTDVGLVRDQNQDAVFEAPDKGIFLVADGMGGEKAGEEASAQVVLTVRDTLNGIFSASPHSPSQLIEILRDTLLQANMDVLQIAVREPDKRGLGSTASLMCLHRGVYFIAQVGDSRIYLCRNCQLKQLTRDHTLVWMLYERGVISRDQIETHPERHLLTQCIGSRRPVTVDLLENSVHENDIFLICSDGLTGMIDDEAINCILTDDQTNITNKGEMLIKAAIEAGGGDNVSAVLVRVTELETGDNWTPDNLGSLQNFEVTKEETIASEEQTTKPPRQPIWPRIWAPALLLVFVLAFAWLKTGDPDAPAPPEKATMATLDLNLPPIPIQRLEITSYQDGQSAGEPIVYGQALLQDQTAVSIPVQPEMRHMIRIRAIGQEDFVTSRQLGTGETATIDVMFPQ